MMHSPPHVIMWTWGGNVSRSEQINAGLGPYFSHLQVTWRTSRTSSQPDCLLLVFFLCFFIYFLLESFKGHHWPCKTVCQQSVQAPQTEMNTSSASSLSLLFVSLSLAKCIFFPLFPWKLLAARLTTRAAVMTLDTRSRVDSALSTLAAFVAEPLGGTIRRALKKKKKGLAAASEEIRAKLILVQQYRHIGVFSFLFFYLRADQTEGQGCESKLDCSCLKTLKKIIIQMKKKTKKNTSGKRRSSQKCPSAILFCPGNRGNAAAFPHVSPSFAHSLFPGALGVIDCTHSSTCAYLFKHSYLESHPSAGCVGTLDEALPDFSFFSLPLSPPLKFRMMCRS